MFGYIAAALAALTVASSLLAWNQNSKLESTRAEISKLHEALGKEGQSRRGFESSAKQCSASVDLLKMEADAVRKAAKDALAQARTASRSVEQRVQAILSEKRPVGLEECANAKRIADQAITDRSAAPFR